jgi:hypothetical protein
VALAQGYAPDPAPWYYNGQYLETLVLVQCENKPSLQKRTKENATVT